MPFIGSPYFDKAAADYDSNAQDVITQDKDASVDNFAKWRITDPLKVCTAFQSQRGALQRLLHDIIYSELRVELGRHDPSGNRVVGPGTTDGRGDATRQ